MRRLVLWLVYSFLLWGGAAYGATTWCGQNPPYASASACVAAICNAMNPPRGFVLGSSSGPDENGIYTQSYNCEGTEGPPPQGPVYGNVTSNPPDVCEPTAGHTAEGAVPRTEGQTVPPQTLCLTKPGGGGFCTYALSVAEEGTDLTDGSLVWLGSWVNTGVSCDGENAGSVEGGPDMSNYDASGQPATEAMEEKLAWLEALKTRSLAQRAGNEATKGPFGDWFAPPSWLMEAVTPGASPPCTLGLEMQGLPVALAAAIENTNMCGASDIIDTYGNFFLWFAVALWSWAILVAPMRS